MTTQAAPLSQAEAEEFAATVGRIADAVNGFMQGKADVVELALVCLLAGGHLLLEDVPGVGKTSLARSLASALGAPWQRIQFTPDLLPGDVTGVSVFHQDSSTFVFHPGPVFANVVLADEINRASPRTQSAMLEVMEEHQVTVDGRPHPVPDPFLVIATQNPVEMDGTYPLPEAQLDRFLIRSTVGYPDQPAEVRVLMAEHGRAGLGDVPQVSSPEQVLALSRTARSVHVAPSVFEYIAAVVARSRQLPQLRLGASPRGGLGLLRASRVRAALQGRTYVVPGDVQALAVPVLAHRMLPTSSFEASGGTTEQVVRDLVAEVPAPPLDLRS
ncbi:MAG: ATPase associated with various cellular 3 [Frankiales bacterium]|nr:ATPase associated with various cellular 3 [Frankiales bacterium]